MAGASIEQGVTHLGAGVINIGVNANGLPGAGAFPTFLGGLQWYAVGLALLGLLVSAAVWAAGSHSENLSWAHKGRLGVIMGMLFSVVVGVAPALVDFFYGAGGTVH